MEGDMDFQMEWNPEDENDVEQINTPPTTDVPGAHDENADVMSETAGSSAGAVTKKMAVVRAQYRHLRTIRESIYGKVKYGEHRESGQPVAVKACSLALISRWRSAHQRAVAEGRSWSECRIEDPQSEAEVMRVLAEPGHPNVIRLHQVLQDAEYLYIIMEFANGGDLFDILRAGVLTEDWARHLFRQLVDAVRYCHSHGVVHGDVSPENCLVTNNATIKLADFGGAALYNPAGFGRERVVGKSFYMAPEILMLFDEPPAVSAYDGFQADVWSCGIIFFLMLTGGMKSIFCGHDNSASATRKNCTICFPTY